MFRTLLAWFLRLFRRKAPSLLPAPTPQAPEPIVEEISAPPGETPPEERPFYSAREFDCAAIRADAMAFLGAEVSPEQLAMVFAEAGAQAVAAGAGSGKSSTLVRRLLVMRHYLHVPLNDLTVITFTRNSRKDFVQKLLEVATAVGAPMTSDLAYARVKTFHAKLIQLTNSVRPGGTDIFEWLGKARRPRPGSREEQEYFRRMDGLAEEVDNPYDRKLSNPQAEILRRVYVEAYRTDERFRAAITTLLQHSLRDTLRQQDTSAEKDWELRRWAQQRDGALSTWVEDHWRKEGLWPVKGVAAPPRVLKVEQLAFRAHGYLPTANAYVVLAGDDLPQEKQGVGRNQFSPYWSSRSKRNVLLRGCSESIFFVRKPKDFERLQSAIEAESDIGEGRAPVFECRLPGEGGSLKGIIEALYELGAFIENIGLNPATDAILLAEKPKGIESKTLYAVGRFFQHFEVYKDENEVCTFNDLFSMLQEGRSELQNIPVDQLRSVKHLLVDEFQDISPLVVGMIRGLHSEIVRREPENENSPTLMVVGDDWQSIYGWRGSAPRFFIEFSRFFSGAAPTPVMLTDNYRSTQNIVDCAANVLNPISSDHKVAKTCRAANPRVAGLPIPVFLVEEMKDAEVGRVLQALADVRSKDEEILVIARTNRVKLVAERALGRSRAGVRVMTVHSGKGLQADYVVVLEDFVYTQSNLIKNALYARAGFPQSFDESQRDETCRLAYVALTRAKKLCIWIGKPEGGAMRTIPERRPYCRRIDIDLLLAELSKLSGQPSSRPSLQGDAGASDKSP